MTGVSAGVLVLAYVVSANGWGVPLLHLLEGGRRAATGASLPKAFLAGLGVLATLWLPLGLAGFFTPALVALVVLTGIVLFVAFGRWLPAAALRALRTALQEIRGEPPIWRGLAFLTAAAVLGGFLLVDAPLHVDAVAYYMALPKVMAASQRVTPLPGAEASAQAGLFGEAHYAALLSLGSPGAARLLPWFVLLAGVALLLSLGRRAGLSCRAQWLTLIIVFTSTTVLYLLGSGKIDLFAAGLGLAAYSQVALGRSLLLGGLLGGWAVMAKVSYAATLAPGLVLLCIWRKTGRAAALRNLLIVAIGAVVALASHLLKNAVLFGNALAPFGEPGPSWVDMVWFGPATTRQIVLTYPLAVTFGQYWAQIGNLSPLLLAFLPLALTLPRPARLRQSLLAIASLSAAAGILAWLVASPSLVCARFLLATLLLLAPLAAQGAAHVTQPQARRPVLGAAVVASAAAMLVLTLAGPLSLQSLPDRVRRALARHSPECELDGIPCRAMAALNRDAQPGARVLLLSFRRYWMRPDLIQCASTSQELGLAALPDPDERWRRIVAQGFRYILVDKETHRPAMAALAPDRLPKWLTLVPVFTPGRFIEVSRIELLETTAHPAYSCRPELAPAWRVAKIPSH